MWFCQEILKEDKTNCVFYLREGELKFRQDMWMMCQINYHSATVFSQIQTQHSDYTHQVVNKPIKHMIKFHVLPNQHQSILFKFLLSIHYFMYS